MEAWKERLRSFLFPAETDYWLAILRVGLGLQVVFYSLSLRNDWNYLFARTHHELIGPQVSEALLSTESPFIPRLGWLIALGAHAGMGEWTVLSITWWILLVSGFGLIAGIFSRTSVVVAWFVHLCAAKSGGLTAYGVDSFMTVGLFYLMLSPLPDHFSLDHRCRHVSLQDRQLLGFFRRVLQVHLCLIYFFSGLTKELGSGWWDGSNLWRSLIRPPFNVIAPELLVKWKYLFPVAGVSICVLEAGYPLFIWNKRTRKIWLTCICGMHMAIGVTMGMYLFALVMIILNLAAFGPGLVWAQPRTIDFDDAR